jgi:hypothetical protein
MSQLDFPYISGTSIYTTVDTYDTTKPQNGALNPLGKRYTFPLDPSVQSSTVNYALGTPLTVAYVRFVSSGAAAMLSGPGLVYWVDKEFSTVTGTASESAFGINGVAGWVLANTTSYPGSLTGAQLTTAVNGNYCFIATGGYLHNAIGITAAAAGDYLIGGATSFTPVRMTANSAPTNTVAGMCATALSGIFVDVLIKNFGPFNF